MDSFPLLPTPTVEGLKQFSGSARSASLGACMRPLTFGPPGPRSQALMTLHIGSEALVKAFESRAPISLPLAYSARKIKGQDCHSAKGNSMKTKKKNDGLILLS